MGDRVTVYLTVLATQADQARNILKDWEPNQYSSVDTDTVELELCGVNYANVEDESKALISVGIPHTWAHDAGGSYEAGSGYAVFDSKGELKTLEFEDKEMRIEPNFVLQLIQSGKTVEEIGKEVQKYAQLYQIPELTQEMVGYGKLYQLKQTIEK